MPHWYVFSDMPQIARRRKRSPAMGLLTSSRSVARDQERISRAVIEPHSKDKAYRRAVLYISYTCLIHVMLNAVKHLSAMWPRALLLSGHEVHPARTGPGEPVGHGAQILPPGGVRMTARRYDLVSRSDAEGP